MKNLFLAALALPIILWSCGGSQQQSVSGTVTNNEGQTISLIGYVNGQPDTVGTATPDASGNFSIPVNGGRLAFYTLSLGDNGALVLAFDSTQSPVVQVDMETAHKTYEVSGSKDSEDLRNLFVNSVQYETAMDSTMKILQSQAASANGDERRATSQAYNNMRTEYRDYLTGLIEADSTSLANFSVLQRLDPKKDLAYFITVRNGLEPRMAGNTFFDQLANNIAQLEAEQKAEAGMAPGAIAPEIALPTPEGETVALSSLKGNYVLIDFWASWCKPCRMENPNVVRMYNKYAEDNFEIYSVSLDKDKSRWENAIAQDQLDWTHVSDLKFWNSAAAKLYGVRSIPFTVLIDPEGKIIQTKLRGRALEAKLSEIFGH